MSALHAAAKKAISDAVEADRARKYLEACQRYQDGINLWGSIMHMERDPAQKERISREVENYQQRFDRLMRFLSEQLSPEPSRVGTPNFSLSPPARAWSPPSTKPVLSLDTLSLEAANRPPEPARRFSFSANGPARSSPVDIRPSSAYQRSGNSFPPVGRRTSMSYSLSPNDYLGFGVTRPLSPPLTPSSPFSGSYSGSPEMHRRKSPPRKTYDKDTEKLRKQMEDTIVSEKPNVRWDDIAGLEDAKQALREAVVLPLQLPHLFQGKRTPWRGILMFGPPGTGKSYLAKAVATEADATFFSVSSSDLVSKWMGESERLIKSLFAMAREQKPAIIFIDELDSICGKRTEGENDGTRRIKTEILVQMQGVGQNMDGVLVLGATNLPNQLDSAVLRRFEQRIYIGLPDAEARKRLFRLEIGSTRSTLGDKEMDELAKLTDGYSGSDISQVCKKANMMPIRKIMDAKFFKRVGDHLCPATEDESGAFRARWTELERSKLLDPPLDMQMFTEAVRATKRTVSARDLTQYREFVTDKGRPGA